MCNLERKLHQLINWVQDPHIDPAQRFQLLQEIAEEAARYKLGGDDKIRVAGGACDGIMGHQRHISDLLAASTLMEKDPPSPYTASLILPTAPAPPATRRGGRTTGSPFNDRGTPTKRKKNRKEVVEDDSSVNGEKKKVPQKRKKWVLGCSDADDRPRGVSPSESVASFKTAEPVARTARQIAAAEAKAKAAARAAADSDEESGDEEPRRSKPMQPTGSTDSMAPAGALGIDIGTSREGSGKPKSRGRKRAHGEDGEEEEEEEEDVPPAKRSAKKNDEELPDDGGADQNEVDSKVYCTCRQFSYGEMIGCDDDDCEIEWVSRAAGAPAGSLRCAPKVETFADISTMSLVLVSTNRQRELGYAHSVWSGGSGIPRRKSRQSRVQRGGRCVLYCMRCDFKDWSLTF